MNRQLSGKGAAEGGDASALSLLVHAADAQHQRPQAKAAQVEGRKPEDDPATQRPSVSRADALQHQGLLSQIRGATGLGEADLLQHNAALVAAQQHQQATALALASDIRSAVAAAQIRQAAQLQNQDFLLARAAAMQQQLGGLGGVDFQQELELQRLEELERRQLLAAAAGAPLGALAARQQLELQEAQLRQEQLDRQIQQATTAGSATESILDRAGVCVPVPDAAAPSARVAPTEQTSKDTFQKTPGSVVVPCRARGMPMDHNFKTAYFVIPENVEHGEELICSYFACRNAGIKFRYCTHCKVPVAKRNFRKRHKHGKTSSSNENDDDQSNSGAEEDTAAASKIKKAESISVVPTEPKVKKEGPAYCQQISKARVEDVLIRAPAIAQPPAKAASAEGATAAAATTTTTTTTAAAAFQPKEVKARKESSKVGGDDNDSALPSQQSRKITPEREKAWASLLTKRPPTKDGEAVSAWLMEVLSVSDLDSPSTSGSSSSKEGGVNPAAVMSTLGARVAPEAAAQAAAASKEWSGAKKNDVLGGQSVLIKKKRPFMSRDDDSKEEAPKHDSFAEWKDRKKHKGPKKGYNVPSE